MAPKRGGRWGGAAMNGTHARELQCTARFLTCSCRVAIHPVYLMSTPVIDDGEVVGQAPTLNKSTSEMIAPDKILLSAYQQGQGDGAAGRLHNIAISECL